MMIWTVGMVLLLVTWTAPSSLAGMNPFCPPRCICNDESYSVTCATGALNEVPITLNPSMERLMLKHNRIKSVDSATFQFYRKLLHMDLSYNELVRVPPTAFKEQEKLTELYLNHNSLSNLTDKTFVGLRSLTVLSLRGNFLEDLPDRVFIHLRNLEVLDLGSNRMASLNAAAFEGVARLRVLSVDDNQIKVVPTLCFAHTPHLADLRIGMNEMFILPDDGFAPLRRLASLDIRSCKFKDSGIEVNAFRGLDTLRFLSLVDNNLTFIPATQLAKLPRLEELKIGQNLFSSLSAHAFKGLKNLRQLEISGAASLVEIRGGVFADNLNLESVEMVSNKQLTYMDEDVFRGLPNLKSLVLRDNGFPTFRETLSAWPQLRKVDLSENPLICDCDILWLRDLAHNGGANFTQILCYGPASLKNRSLKGLTDADMGCDAFGDRRLVFGIACGVVFAAIVFLLILLVRYRHELRDAFKNYKWKNQTSGGGSCSKGKASEYQKTFYDDEFMIRNLTRQTLKPVPVTEL